MWAKLVLFGVTAIAACTAAASGDQASSSWLSGREQSPIRWTPLVEPPRLSPLQRLWTQFTIRPDAQEIARRGGQGQFVAEIEVRDVSGRRYRIQQELNAASGWKCSALAFLLPGTYRVSLALAEPSSGKYSLKRRTLKVAALHGDPLPEAWRDLPAVEFASVPGAPDRWFLPAISSRPALPLANRHAVRIEIIANTSITEQTRAPEQVYETAMSTMGPLLKVVTGVAPRDGLVNVTCLDVWRQRVTFEQRAVHSLDWPRLRQAMIESDPGRIDAQALHRENQSSSFFADQIAQLLAAPGVRVAIVLSAPVVFREKQVLHPLPLQPGPNLRLFYIRLRNILMMAPSVPMGTVPMGTAAVRAQRQEMEMPGAPLGAPPPIVDPGAASQVPVTAQVMGDQLAQALNSLQPRVFDATSPGEVRKALAAIIHEIEQMTR